MPLLTRQAAQGHLREDSTVPLDLTRLQVIILALTGTAIVGVHFGSYSAVRSGQSKIPSAIQSSMLRRVRTQLLFL